MWVRLVRAAPRSPSPSGSSPSAGGPRPSAAPVQEVPGETAGPFPGDGTNGPNVLDDSGIVRKDIRPSFGTSTTVATGVPLTIRLTVRDASSGDALTGAAVYVWQCDREGAYSLYGSGLEDENYLRGVQPVDATGTATFTSVFPGCYSGRWPHIHFEVYPGLADAIASGPIAKISQIALPREACESVYATDGYGTSLATLSRLSLAGDGVFGDDGGIHQLAVMSGDARPRLHRIPGDRGLASRDTKAQRCTNTATVRAGTVSVPPDHAAVRTTGSTLRRCTWWSSHRPPFGAATCWLDAVALNTTATSSSRRSRSLPTRSDSRIRMRPSIDSCGNETRCWISSAVESRNSGLDVLMASSSWNRSVADRSCAAVGGAIWVSASVAYGHLDSLSAGRRQARAEPVAVGAVPVDRVEPVAGVVRVAVQRLGAQQVGAGVRRTPVPWPSTVACQRRAPASGPGRPPVVSCGQLVRQRVVQDLVVVRVDVGDRLARRVGVAGRRAVVVDLGARDRSARRCR